MSVISMVEGIKKFRKMNVFKCLFFITSIILLQAVVANFVYLSGGTKSSFVYLMLFTIITGSFIFGPTGGWVFGLTGGIFLGPLMPMDSQSLLMQDLSNWTFRLFFYMLAGIYSGALIKHLSNTISQLSTITLYHAKTDLPNRKYFENIDLKIFPCDTYFATLKFENYDVMKEAFGEDYTVAFVKKISAVLTDVFGKKDLATVFSLGPGKFGFIFFNSDIEGNLKSLTETIEEKVDQKEIEYFPNAFIGVSKLQGDNKVVMQNSDIARRTARKNLTHYEIYSEEMRAESQKNFDLFCEIPRAMNKNEFFMVYHPKVDLSSGRVEGVEALIRWGHPERGFISPIDFIPHIEQTAMIGMVTEWVLETSLMDLKNMQSQGIDINISVNIPLKLLENPKLISIIRGYEKMLPLNKLELEILERGSLDDFKSITAIMDSLRNIGVRFSLDDFGTGYSTLSCIQNLPLDIIKIDRTFVKDITTNKTNKKLVRSSVNIGHALDKKIVAEGVESEETLKILRDMGCDYAQGYYFTKPLKYDEFIEWYRTYTTNNYNPMNQESCAVSLKSS